MTDTDIKTGLDMHTKRVAESLDYDFTFTNLDFGEVIASINSVSQANRGEVDGSADLTIGTTSHDGVSIVQVKLSGGTDKEFYCITIAATTSTGEIRTCSGVLSVRNPCG